MTDAVRSTVHEPPRLVSSDGDDLGALHAREIERLVAYLFCSDRALGTDDAEAVAEQVFLQLKGTWPSAGGYPSHRVHLFATAQRVASTWVRRASSPADPLKDAAPAYWDRADVARLTVLQDGLDRLPDVPRRIVLLRELCGFGPAETALVMSLPESAVEVARADALRALVPMIDSATSSGAARRGRLVPEDFGALARVLQVDDGRVAATRRRFAESLAARPGPAAGSGTGPGTAPTAATVRPTVTGPPVPGSAPPPPTVAPPAPATAAFAGSGADSDITRIAPPAPPTFAPPAGGPPPTFAPPPSNPPTYAAPPPAPPRYSAPPLSGLPRRMPDEAPTGLGNGAPPPGPGLAAPDVLGERFGTGAASWPSAPTSPPPGALPSPPPFQQVPAEQHVAPSPSAPLPAGTPLDAGWPIGGPGGSLAGVETPIFDSVSAWFSAGGGTPWAALDDAGWRAANERAAAQPRIAGSTDAGLPRRRPGANTVPSASEAGVRTSMFGPESGRIDAGAVRSRLDSFQQGLRSARQLRDDVNEPIAAEAAAALEASREANGNLFGAPGTPRFQAPEPGVVQRRLDVQPGGHASEAPDRPRPAPRGARRSAHQAPPAAPTAPSTRSGSERPGQADRDGPAASGAVRPSEVRGFGAFYRDYLPQLLALLMVEGARPAAAAEIAQEVMSAAYKGWARIEQPREWTRERALAAWADRRGSAGDGPLGGLGTEDAGP